MKTFYKALIAFPASALILASAVVLLYCSTTGNWGHYWALVFISAAFFCLSIAIIWVVARLILWVIE